MVRGRARNVSEPAGRVLRAARSSHADGWPRIAYPLHQEFRERRIAMRSRLLLAAVSCLGFFLAGLAAAPRAAQKPPAPPLWRLYDETLAHAQYVDLTHAITPHIPVWAGFGPARFGPAVDPKSGKPYTYGKDGFEATRYELQTDQLGTQLDPPAHWDP